MFKKEHYNHRPLKVTFVINGFLIMSNNPFDSTLARLYFELQKAEGIFDGDYNQELPFLKKTDGIYHASCPVIDVRFLENQTIFGKFDTQLFTRLGGDLKTEHLEASRGPFKAKLEKFEKHYVDNVEVFLNGDVEYIEYLLSFITHIGAKTSNNWGRVEKIFIEELDCDYSIISENGQLARPVPDLPQYQGDNRARIVTALTSPYWGKHNNSIGLVNCQGAKKEELKHEFSQEELEFVSYPQKFLAKHFKYNNNVEHLFSLVKTTKKTKNKNKLVDGSDESEKYVCAMCGHTHFRGAIIKTKTHLSATYNNMYSHAFPLNEFVCEYCMFNIKNYNPNKETGLDKMGNIFITKDGYIPFRDTDIIEYINNTSDKFNKLPHVVMIAERVGPAAIVDAGHSIVATVSKDYASFVIGNKLHKVSKKAVLNTIEDFYRIAEIAKKEKIKLSSDVLFNRAISEKYTFWFTEKLRFNGVFIKEYKDFINKYDQDTRLIAKMVISAQTNTNKEEN